MPLGPDVPRKPQRVASVIAVALLAAATLASLQWTAAAQRQGASWFMHAADPQVGYGELGRDVDAQRFRRLLERAHALGAQFVVVAGDLVQDRTWLQWRSFESARKDAAVPLYFVAGNHDVVDLDTLAAYRERVGPDHYVARRAGVVVVALDSEVMRDTRIDAAEHATQWRWLEKTLATERCRQSVCVAVMHRPPFVERADERDTDQNWPASTRARLLSLFQRHGVTTVLAGHLHETREAFDAASGVHVYVVGGTARVFDERGAGYRAFQIGPTGLSQRYVLFERFAVIPDFMGVDGWTPRLFAPSLRHWLLTLAECACGVLAWLVAAAWAAAGLRWPRTTAVALWRTIAAAFVFLGINEQMDFDELAVGLLRRAARASHWLDIRHTVGGIVAGGVVLAACALAVLMLARAGRGRALAWPVLLGLAVPCAWFVLSTLSDHGFGMVVSADTWDLLLFVAAGFSLFICSRALRQAHQASVGR